MKDAEHRKWLEESIHHNGLDAREPEWTESVAVGSKTFIEGIREELQPGLRGRKMRETGGHYELREQGAAYSVNFAPKNVLLSTEDTYILDLNIE